jgi:hypothetical protein
MKILPKILLTILIPLTVTASALFWPASETSPFYQVSVYDTNGTWVAVDWPRTNFLTMEELMHGLKPGEYTIAINSYTNTMGDWLQFPKNNVPDGVIALTNISVLWPILEGDLTEPKEPEAPLQFWLELIPLAE